MGLEVFFTADDFGLDDSVNEAVIYSFRDGALNAASLMMGQAGSAAAVDLARKHPALAVGCHFHLCDSHPVTCERWPWGDSPSRAGWSIFLSLAGRRLIAREITAQWALFRQTGLPCRFVNVHHHLHVHPQVFSELMHAIGPGFRGWMRFGRPCYFKPKFRSKAAARVIGWVRTRRRRSTGQTMSDSLWGIDRTFRMKAEEVSTTVNRLGSGLHEFMFHPRSADPGRDQDARALVELRSMAR